MRHVCTGCGNEIPEGQDFCYICGAWSKNSLALSEEGDTLYAEMCIKCSKPIPSGSEYCLHCGERIEERKNVPIRVRKIQPFTRKDLIAIALAIIPGFFNIFGLGQIVQRRWSRAFVFICATMLLLYIGPSFLGSSTHYMTLVLIQVAVFVFSISDVLRGVGERGI